MVVVVALVATFPVSAFAQHVDTYDYDVVGRVETVTQSSGTETEFTYDVTGNRGEKADIGQGDISKRELGGTIVYPVSDGYRVLRQLPAFSPVSGSSQ